MATYALDFEKPLLELEQKLGDLKRHAATGTGSASVDALDGEIRRLERRCARLQQEMRVYVANPAGVGLDVPAWLRRLEAEVRRVQASRSSMAALAENFFRVPRREVSHADVQRQLREWERPALPQ